MRTGSALLAVLRQLFLILLASARSTRSLLAPGSIKGAISRAQSSGGNALLLLLTLFLSYLPLRKMPRTAKTTDAPLSLREDQEELKMEQVRAEEDRDAWRASAQKQRGLKLAEKEVGNRKGLEDTASKEKEEEEEGEPEPERTEKKGEDAAVEFEFKVQGGGGGGVGRDVTLEYDKSPSPQHSTEFFSTLEDEWKEEDMRAQEPESLVGRMVWMPILVGLRGVSVVLGMAFAPMFFALRTLFGINTENANFWDVPLERRKQTAVTFFMVMFYPLCGFFGFLTLVLLFVPGLNFFVLLYLVYIFRWDDSAWSGRRRPFMRYWKVWRHFVNYFPVRLIKTHNLDPRGKYIFCYHPHGIIPVGALGNFAMDATGFSRRFPGIDVRFLTLNVNFMFPVMRELFLSLGMLLCC